MGRQFLSFHWKVGRQRLFWGLFFHLPLHCDFFRVVPLGWQCVFSCVCFWILGLAYISFIVTRSTQHPFLFLHSSYFRIFGVLLLPPFTILLRNIHDPWCHFLILTRGIYSSVHTFVPPFYFFFRNSTVPPHRFTFYMSILALTFHSFFVCFCVLFFFPILFPHGVSISHLSHFFTILTPIPESAYFIEYSIVCTSHVSYSFPFRLVVSPLPILHSDSLVFRVSVFCLSPFDPPILLLSLSTRKTFIFTRHSRLPGCD